MTRRGHGAAPRNGGARAPTRAPLRAPKMGAGAPPIKGAFYVELLGPLGSAKVARKSREISTPKAVITPARQGTTRVK